MQNSLINNAQVHVENSTNEVAGLYVYIHATGTASH